MSSRTAQKEERRIERERRAEEAAREQRRRRRWLAAAGSMAVLGIAVVVAAVIASGGGDDPAARGEAAFGQHYDGLQERRAAAGVSTMGQPTSNEHTHQKLSVWVDGTPMRVPENIGIDPNLPGEAMASLHTHTPDGLIHNEGQANSTLGQLFAVWGVAFGPTRLGPYRAREGKVVQLWVNGKQSTAWGSLPLVDKQDITVTFGRPRTAPPVR